jgi:hypothetical protein
VVFLPPPHKSTFFQIELNAGGEPVVVLLG